MTQLRISLPLFTLLALAAPNFNTVANARIPSPNSSQQQSLNQIEGDIQLAQASRCRIVSTQGSNLIIRKGPGTQYPVIGSLANGSRVIIGNRGRGGWVPLTLQNELVGYISARYLRYC
ncbi:MAG: SH3 domain-containing protein [Chroococcales cyanobacterium]